MAPKIDYIEQEHTYYRDDGSNAQSSYKTNHRVKLDKLQLLSEVEDSDVSD